MKITWLGQAGLLFEHNDTRIIIDPYLSDSCHKVNPKSLRRYPVDESFLKIKPDVLVLTHKHLDHTDPETLEHYLKDDSKVTVLASFGAWEVARKFSGDNNYVLFNQQTEFTVNGICFKAVYAEHSDFDAVGVTFEVDGKVYYVTGDTLYNEKVFSGAPKQVDALFLPVNGKGNNMNMTDAVRFAKRVNAKKTIPLHWGLFDELSSQDVSAEGFKVLKPYEQIEL